MVFSESKVDCNMQENGIQLTSVSKTNRGFDMGPELIPQIRINDLIMQTCEKSFTEQPSNNFKVEMDGPIAIKLDNVTKFYQPGVPILNNLNMTVQEGSIYTLLGSSGCGKTTLLSCIIGLQKIDSGKILVFGHQPCSKESFVPGEMLGYMPQEISLYPNLSIQELLGYFGMLYGMGKQETRERTKFLVEFLHLPESSRRIATLSGGQKRRVSFAVSLLPDPPLLILDEPTVGVDPLLRESIWNHLVELVSRKKTTVIITTHYIDESIKSDKIGFMRNGRLLIEQSPQSLMDEHSTSLLSPIVLKLCKEDSSSSSSDLRQLVVNNVNNLMTVSNNLHALSIDTYKTPFQAHTQVPNIHMAVPKRVRKSSKQQTKNHLLAMIKKNSMLITRNYLFLLFLICVPAIQACLFCLAVGNDPKPLPFGVVNLEVNYSEACVVNMEEDGCMTENLSCKFIEKISREEITLYFFETEEHANESLSIGEIWGYLIFPKEYSEHFYTRATSGSQFADNETIIGSNILFQMDATSKQITSTLIKVFTDVFKDFSRALLSSCGYDERIADIPMKFLTPLYGNYTAGFRDFLAPSLVLGILFFFPIISSSMQCIREKKQGTLERTVVAGVRTWEILIAYSVTESVIVLFQTGLGFFIVSLVFQIPIKGSVTLVVALCMLIGLSGVSVGFLIGTFCREETEAALLSMAVFFPNFILAGMFWPIQGLPVVLQYLAYSLPCTLASESIRSIVNRGWGFLHPKVYPGFVVTFAWISFYWIMNIILHTRASIRRRG